MRRYALFISLSMITLILVACAGSSKASVSGEVDIRTLSWCGSPSLLFADDSSSPSTSITSWAKVQTQLGFEPLLPPQLPRDSCLFVAGGTLHDPLFGASFSITYELPNGGTLSLAEAPVTAGVPVVPCTQKPGPGTLQITSCEQVRNSVSITISGTESSATIAKRLAGLQTGVSWLPAGTPAELPTPTPHQ